VASTSGATVARTTIGVALLGLAGAWNGGNVGPVAEEIADDMDVSLGEVGLLSGTFFFASAVLGLLFAAQIGERIGLLRGLWLGLGLTVAGNVVFALTPIFAGLAVGRILPGLGFALINTLGAVWARAAGGARLLGVFGASIQLGVALALLLGSVLSDLDVDWRVGFVVSAALAAAALVAIPRDAAEAVPPQRAGTGFFHKALRRARVYRLGLLFVSIYGVPMVLSAWLIQYLTLDGDVTKSVAGVAAFLLFGLSAVMRIAGARLQQRGTSHLLLGGALLVAAIGLAAVALEPVAAAAFAGVALLAFGFGIPYAVALTEAQQLDPEAPGEPVALMTLFGLGPPIIVIPFVGRALELGDGALAFWGLAAFLVVATLANLRPAGRPVTGPGSESG
jgi:predicted MFS family arabinose efflux permease